MGGLTSLARSTNYTAGSRTARASVMNSRPTGPNSAIRRELALIQSRSQDANRNYPYIRSAIRQLVSHEVGTGIKPKFRVKNETHNAALSALGGRRVRGSWWPMGWVISTPPSD